MHKKQPWNVDCFGLEQSESHSTTLITESSTIGRVEYWLVMPRENARKDKRITLPCDKQIELYREFW